MTTDVEPAGAPICDRCEIEMVAHCADEDCGVWQCADCRRLYIESGFYNFGEPGMPVTPWNPARPRRWFDR